MMDLFEELLSSAAKEILGTYELSGRAIISISHPAGPALRWRSGKNTYWRRLYVD